MKPPSVPTHNSISRSSVPPTALDNDSCGSSPQVSLPTAPESDTGGNMNIQETEVYLMFSSNQSMQPQHCNIITTVCQTASGREGGAQKSPVKGFCVLSPGATAKMADREKEDLLTLPCDRAACCDSYVDHANVQDAFAAYCHPQPIPTPSQVLPCPLELSCDVQYAVTPPTTTNPLTLPRLTSSVSETGLEAKQLLHCCNLGCTWISMLPPGAGPQQCCSRTMTQDMGTMTEHKELRDVGVQTGWSITPHIFPQTRLTEKTGSETLNMNNNGGQKPTAGPKTPVKEVKWDAEGMTWEVYGASVDPEELGLAIQRHLELQIKETANQASKISQQNNSSQQNRQKRTKMMSSIPTPSCCVTSTAVD